jgi:hypothetical protein
MLEIGAFGQDSGECAIIHSHIERHSSWHTTQNKLRVVLIFLEEIKRPPMFEKPEKKKSLHNILLLQDNVYN